MKIAVLGAANSSHITKIINGLYALGHEVCLYSLAGHRDVDGAVTPKARIVYLEGNYFTAHKGLRRELSAFTPDVLYAHYATGYGTIARKTKFHPAVLAVWGSDIYDFPKKSPIHAWMVRRNLAFADRVFSTSRAMAGHTQQYTKKEIYITPFGTDLLTFRPASVQEKQDRPIHIGYLKTVAPIYGIEDLVRAFSLLVERLPEVPLLLDVYGDGSQLDEMKQLSHTLGLDHCVVFHGRVPHAKAPEVLQSLDILCVPSLRESFGVSVVEGMACGIPCIVSSADGLQEVSEDGITGLTVPVQDPQALCDAMERLVLAPDLRKKMGLAGRRRVETLYNWQDNIKVIEKGLKQTIQESMS